ncbi:hypothetical protein [Streptomonospora wellingtoniae]|uniref:Uncharacterized protein n=1 Tax=Streptomonospora wellingtoniae TaxID=3075544 RepID=A0ABU2KZK0_9ACTN|nr:hypothetical protein [Streptomonospora sp. DSM 45055]MDT0304719.1 hypothetical protein [Streptomonospora sp. DSM 45055]
MPETAPCCAGGQWRQMRDFFQEAWTEDLGRDEALEAAGFESAPWTVIGDGGLAAPLTLRVFAFAGDAADKPGYLVEIEGNGDAANRHVYAWGVPDLMAILSRWAPLCSPPPSPMR